MKMKKPEPVSVPETEPVQMAVEDYEPPMPESTPESTLAEEVIAGSRAAIDEEYINSACDSVGVIDARPEPDSDKMKVTEFVRDKGKRGVRVVRVHKKEDRAEGFQRGFVVGMGICAVLIFASQLFILHLM